MMLKERRKQQSRRSISAFVAVISAVLLLAFLATLESSIDPPVGIVIQTPTAETDFFKITIGSEHYDGSGLVFRDSDKELSLRGLFGAEMDHLQLDLTSSSGFGEQRPPTGPVISQIIGLDALTNAYNLVKHPNNRLSINERGPALTTVWGNFSFLAKDASSGKQVTISGVFDLLPIGTGDWNCDWSGEIPACGFIS